MKKLAERAGGVYRASAGTIYPTRQLPGNEGLITFGPLRGSKQAGVSLSDAVLLAVGLDVIFLQHAMRVEE